eukprot:30676-Pelagococcus_subviridis.AAC.3
MPARCDSARRVGNIGDGGKYVCLSPLQSHRCVVYSLGSRLDFSFELALQNMTGCEVHTFDCTVGVPGSGVVPEGINFHPWCAGPHDEIKFISSDLGHTGEKGQYYTLQSIMNSLAHDSIELLKMDIERHEVEVISTLAKHTAPSQLVFETHLHNAYGMWGRPVNPNEWNSIWSRLESLGYGVFSYEPNDICLCCSEWSLLRN